MAREGLRKPTVYWTPIRRCLLLRSVTVANSEQFIADPAEQESGADWNQFAGGSFTRRSPAPSTAHITSAFRLQ